MEAFLEHRHQLAQFRAKQQGNVVTNEGCVSGFSSVVNSPLAVIPTQMTVRATLRSNSSQLLCSAYERYNERPSAFVGNQVYDVSDFQASSVGNFPRPSLDQSVNYLTEKRKTNSPSLADRKKLKVMVLSKEQLLGKLLNSNNLSQDELADIMNRVEGLENKSNDNLGISQESSNGEFSKYRNITDTKCSSDRWGSFSSGNPLFTQSQPQSVDVNKLINQGVHFHQGTGGTEVHGNVRGNVPLYQGMMTGNPPLICVSAMFPSVPFSAPTNLLYGGIPQSHLNPFPISFGNQPIMQGSTELQSGFLPSQPHSSCYHDIPVVNKPKINAEPGGRPKPLVY